MRQRGQPEFMKPLQGQEIEQLIANAILEHRLVPGQHLNEAQLAKAFGVSRAAIRFALMSLENDGIVTIEQNRGAFVARPTLEEAVHLFQALAALEKAATELILHPDRQLSADGVAKLEAIHYREVDAQKSGDLSKAIHLSMDFHVQFISLAGNPILVDTHRRLLMQYRLVTAVFRTSMDYCALDDHHIDMVHLLREGASAKLKRLIEAHFKHIILGHTPIPAEPADLLAALKVS
jgi:DNA-binding GntR family transcriptional regulator